MSITWGSHSLHHKIGYHYVRVYPVNHCIDIKDHCLLTSKTPVVPVIMVVVMEKTVDLKHHLDKQINSGDPCAHFKGKLHYLLLAHFNNMSDMVNQEQCSAHAILYNLTFVQ